jgi:hypothetical protein
VTNDVGDVSGEPDGDPGADSEQTDTTADTVDTEVLKEEPGWHPISLGANGDLHQIRFFSELGFRIVGHGGTILRAHGDGWIREWAPHDAPAFHDIARANNSLHAVGQSGWWVTRDESGAWHRWENSVKVHLNGISALADGLIAVGNGGTVVRRHATGLKYEQVNPDYDINAIAGVGSGEAFAAATGGRVLRRGLEPGPCELSSGDICAPCNDDQPCKEGICRVFLGADEARCTISCASNQECPTGLECMGDGDDRSCQPPPVVDWFATEVAPAETRLRGVFALDPFNVWVVGDGAYVARFSGPWTKEPCEDERNLYGVGGGAGRLFAVGEKGAFLSRAAGGDWAKADDLVGPLLAGERYESVAVGGERVIAVGANGALQVKILPDKPFLDSTAQPSGVIRDIAVSGSSAAIVGDLGLLVWLDDAGYGALESGVTTDLNAAHWSVPGETLWVVGHGGTLLRRSAGAPVAAISTPTTADLHGLTQLPDGALLAVGQAGTVIRINPVNDELVFEDSGQVNDLLDVFMDGSVATAVGKSGTILRRLASGWEPVDANVFTDLHAGHSNGELALAVGAQGVVVHWSQGGDPVTTSADPLSVYFDVLVRDDNSATLVGWAGALHRRDADGKVTALEAPTKSSLYAIDDAAEGLLIGGTSGALWQHKGDR